MSCLVECIELAKWFSIDAPAIFQGLNISVGENESLAVMGSSGVGKTTLLNIIGLLDEPSMGECRILGQSSMSLSWSEKAQLRNQMYGFVFQNDRLIPHYTVLDNVLLPLRYRKVNFKEAHKNALDILEYFDLAFFAKRYPRQLSGGQRQRVALARAVINRPRVLLADEPTSSLDETTKQAMLQNLFKLKDTFGFSMIIVTHDPFVANQCGRQLTLC